MTPNPGPNDWPEAAEYDENRAKFTVADLLPYAGKYVAFSMDGKRILASGATDEEMEQNLIAQGIPPNRVVGSYIDPY